MPLADGRGVLVVEPAAAPAPTLSRTYQVRRLGTVSDRLPADPDMIFDDYDSPAPGYEPPRGCLAFEVVQLAPREGSGTLLDVLGVEDVVPVEDACRPLRAARERRDRLANERGGHGAVRAPGQLGPLLHSAHGDKVAGAAAPEEA